MNLSQPQRVGIFVALAMIMAGTRINHFGALPDASWAIFFVAGFYLRGSLRWVFPALMTLAVFVDYLVISGQGLNFWSHYCVSPGYWFLIAAYGAMSLGGMLLRAQHKELGLRSLGLLVASFVIAECVCFVVSNGSFYWLSSSVASTSMSGWMQNMADWYLPYLRTSGLYVGVATVLHLIGTRSLHALDNQTQSSIQRG
ncbi:MAG: hypothetical protein ABIR27_04695 [Dokdonella sp.]